MHVRLMAGMPGQMQPGFLNMMGGGMPEGSELLVWNVVEACTVYIITVKAGSHAQVL